MRMHARNASPNSCGLIWNDRRHLVIAPSACTNCSVPSSFAAASHDSVTLFGSWHDEPNSVSLSCDAAANDEGTEQFVQADGAITKCLRSFQISPQLFGDAFLACIRMVRADYCGDGHPHTYAGTEVGVATPQSPMTSAECK